MSRAGRLAAVLVGLTAVAALVLGWLGQQRIDALERELVRRQQASAEQAGEAHVIAKQAQAWSQEANIKSTLLESRVNEVALQRSQLEELMQSVSRSRDENLVADLEAGLRMAMQHAAITGSAEPLVAALKTAEDRLARGSAPRLEPVQRAIQRDLERVKAASVTDLGALAARLDEAMRLADEAPLLVIDAAAQPAAARTARRTAASAAAPAPSAASAAGAPASAAPGWHEPALAWWRTLWGEVRGLVRVTRIDQPEAMLLAPEQAWFLRENLKLRLLNARLALLGRQFDTAQTDLQAAAAATERYFERGARKTVLLAELLRGVAAQARQVAVPRPDDTLAALATAAAGR